MGMIKKGAASAAVENAANALADEIEQKTKALEKSSGKLDSGTAAAVSRLSKKTTETSEKKYPVRDFDKEARGKTRCVQIEAAFMSPAIAGMKFDTMADYLKLCKEAADFGTNYTFGE